MAHSDVQPNRWQNRRIGITGARGALGRALTTRFLAKGAHVTGFTHSAPKDSSQDDGPERWVQWSCGAEDVLRDELKQLDVLVLNHGINPQGDQTPDQLTTSLEVNALSTWRLIRAFEACGQQANTSQPREIWINTSEAEIQPAVSPGYEISKRLIGQLVSIHGAVRSAEARKALRIRKLVLGPFRSELNPIGLMDASFVAGQIVLQAGLGLNLIIVSPNPLTYVLMPLSELGRRLYSRALNRPGP